ncbi:hypothetical protein [Agrobacterium cavarae]|uniref:hypothetical protein n=1 Tax=Agrobacterium cavarae TaxID=2528239 RepID=UPI0028A12357|nr:hypothetical protein [Agrobacterium cavarae]
MTEKAVLKNFKTLSSDAMSSVRYDGTLPFRAAKSTFALEMPMRQKPLQVDQSTRFTSSILKAVIAIPLMVVGSPAFAGPLETALFNATVPYVALKRGSVECGKPDGEHVAYKQRVLNLLGRIPNVDLIVADREMERAFEREVTKHNPTCSDALLERYKYTMTRGAEASIEALTDAVSDQLRKQ